MFAIFVTRTNTVSEETYVAVFCQRDKAQAKCDEFNRRASEQNECLFYFVRELVYSDSF